MEKLILLFCLLAVILYLVQAGSIKQTAELDPRCNGKFGIFPLEDDCTSYLKCTPTGSRVIPCPEGFLFDTYKHCNVPDDADCGRDFWTMTPDSFVCPEFYGYFRHPKDCRKYYFCSESRPYERTCPDNMVYVPYIGCYESDDCFSDRRV